MTPPWSDLLFVYLWLFWGLTCSMQTLVVVMGSVVAVWGLSFRSVACGIFVPQPGVEPTCPALQRGFLTTEPPGKSLMVRSLSGIIINRDLRKLWTPCSRFVTRLKQAFDLLSCSPSLINTLLSVKMNICGSPNISVHTVFAFTVLPHCKFYVEKYYSNFLTCYAPPHKGFSNCFPVQREFSLWTTVSFTGHLHYGYWYLCLTSWTENMRSHCMWWVQTGSLYDIFRTGKFHIKSQFPSSVGKSDLDYIPLRQGL